MDKIYVKRYLLAIVLLVFTTSGLYAQEEPIDSVARGEGLYKGRLFSSDAVTNTSATASVSGERLYKTNSPTLTNSLAGQIPGFSMQIGNGNPGSDNAKWLIRGIGSYTYGRENESKIFVDGFEVDAEYLSYMIPAEIEDVSILKDAAGLTPFGMSGSNGVVWVTTKRGELGKPSINVQVRTAAHRPINIAKPLNSYDFASLYNQAISNDNGMVWSPRYSQSDMQGYLDGTLPNIDWNKQVIRDNANYTDVAASIRGGIKAARYNVVMGYSNQQGLMNVKNRDNTSNSNMGRFNLRANVDLEFFSIFEAKIDFGARLEERKWPNFDMNQLMNNVASYPSNLYWVYDDPEMNNYSGTALFPDNPVASIKGLGWGSSRTRITQANFTLKERLDFITEGLYLQQAFSFYSRTRSAYYKRRNYARWMDGETTTTDQDTPLKASGYGSDGMVDWKQGELSMGYNRTFNRHNINAAVSFYVSDRKGDGRFDYKYRNANLYGRFNYSYDSRYSAEFGFSHYGSDAFMDGNRWGFYPSVSAAWVISNEEFLKHSDAVQFLKLRASVGKTGSSNAGGSVNVNGYDSYGRYLYQQYFYWNDGFSTGTNAPYQWNSSIVPRFVANPNIFAETSMKYNIGVELNLYNKLDLTADLFMDKRKDILTPDNSIMDYYGEVHYVSNIGKMTNRGFEIGAMFSDKVGSVEYAIFAQASYAKNKIDYMAEVSTPHPYNSATGLAYGTPMGLVADGFYQMEDFNEDGTLKDGVAIPTFGAVQPGDLRYKDLDGDGIIDETDIKSIGNPAYPKLNYSFGASLYWKGLDFNIMFRGASGASVNLMNHQAQFVAYMDNRNAFPIAQKAWAYYPDQGIDNRSNASYPRLTTLSNENNYRTSSFWIVSNNFLRIQNIEVGYDFTDTLIPSSTLSSLRLFVNATNPFTWSKLLKDYDMDPESYFGYPAIKSFSVGVSVTF